MFSGILYGRVDSSIRLDIETNDLRCNSSKPRRFSLEASALTTIPPRSLFPRMSIVFKQQVHFCRQHTMCIDSAPMMWINVSGRVTKKGTNNLYTCLLYTSSRTPTLSLTFTVLSQEAFQIYRYYFPHSDKWSFICMSVTRNIYLHVCMSVPTMTFRSLSLPRLSLIHI